MGMRCFISLLLAGYSVAGFGEAAGPESWRHDPEIYADHPTPQGKYQKPISGHYSWPGDHLLGQRQAILNQDLGPAQRLRLLQQLGSKPAAKPYQALLEKDQTFAAIFGLRQEGSSLGKIIFDQQIKKDGSTSHQLTLVVYWQDPQVDIALHVVEPGGRHFTPETPSLHPSLSQLTARPQMQAVSWFSAPVMQAGSYRVFVRCRKGCSAKQPIPVEIAIKRLDYRRHYSVVHAHTKLFGVGDTRTIWQYRYSPPGLQSKVLSLAELEMRWRTWQKAAQYDLALRKAMELGPLANVQWERRRYEIIAAAYQGLGEAQQHQYFQRKINKMAESESPRNN